MSAIERLQDYELLAEDAPGDRIVQIMAQLCAKSGRPLIGCPDDDFYRLLKLARAQYYAETGDRRALPLEH